MSEPRGNRTFLGIDYGRRRTGIARSDPEGLLAVPVTTLIARGLDDLAARIFEQAREHEASALILGFPRRQDGMPGDLAAEVEDLARRLRERGLDVRLWDEGLTTWEAESRLRASSGGTGRSARERIRRRIDAAAATVLLQSYLESLPRL